MFIKNGPCSGFPLPGLFTQLRGVFLSGQMLKIAVCSWGDAVGVNNLLSCSGTDSGDKQSMVGVAQTPFSSW